MADAEAIAEAVTRPNMRFVVAKAPSEQSAMMLHKVRMMLNRQVVMLTNALRAHMAEFGIIAPVERGGVDRLLTVIDDETDDRVPSEARVCLQMLTSQLKLVKLQILENDRRVLAAARSTELGRRLMEVPGIGPLVASALVACVPIRRSSAAGATCQRGSARCRGRTPPAARSGWDRSPRPATGICDRCCSPAPWRSSAARCRAPVALGSPGCSSGASRKVAAMALANKNARIAWSMMMSGERYRQPMAIAG
jgi:transposase